MGRHEVASTTISRILTFIRARNYEPKERLPSERDLAEKFATSRSAIREALATLEAMRVIERRPNSGIYLREWDQSSIEALVLHADSGLSLTREEVAKALEVRRILEVEAVRLACSRRTAADLKNLREILDETAARVAKRQSIENEDQAFHLGIVVATRNDVLVRVVNAFYEMSKQRRQLYFSDADRCELSYREHCRIVDAVEAREPDAAAQRMSEHLSQTAGSWASLLSDTDA
ncbi:FadR/GntR family transcriptional regulator [Afipia carboxidovorans]|uniref:FadR/GntR family transcriptional regulator n=1 Tax=Afipia carboxidovorans TaxID=40137 RepID=UPI00308FF7E9|nr:FadR/GntR family transcriptional regulator [Afipia carboxidovorans]